MGLITRRKIEAFAESHEDAAQALADWCAMVEAARWTDALHLQTTSQFPARPISGNRVVFNIKGNSYRIICAVRYADITRDLNGVVLVKFVGTHAQYDDIDAETVEYSA